MLDRRIGRIVGQPERDGAVRKRHGRRPAMARVRFHGGSSLTSTFVTAQGVGAVAGALLVPVLAQRYGRRRVMLGGFVWLPIALILYGASPRGMARF